MAENSNSHDSESAAHEETTDSVDSESGSSLISKPPSPRDKKEEKLCASVVKGQECRNQKAGLPCPFSHEVPSYHKNIYICHLPLNYTKEQLETLVTGHGKINECRILVDPHSLRSRGVGFVHFESHVDAKNAITAVNNMRLPNHSQPLQARFAKINKKKEGGGRGGPRGGPRGGRRGDRDYGPVRRGDRGRGDRDRDRGDRGDRYSRRGPPRRDPYYDDRYDDFYDDFYDEYPRSRGSYPPPPPPPPPRGGYGGSDRGYDRAGYPPERRAPPYSGGGGYDYSAPPPPPPPPPPSSYSGSSYPPPYYSRT